MCLFDQEILLLDPSESFLIDENFHIDLSEFETSDSEEGKPLDVSKFAFEEFKFEFPEARMKEVHIRTHKGSGDRHINFQMLQEVGHLPQQKAADALKIGNTRFKTVTRQLGMKGWPYRKIKSILNLIKTIEDHREYFGDDEADNIIGKLKILKTTIFHSPDTVCYIFSPFRRKARQQLLKILQPLSPEYKKFRQTAYKLTHTTRQRNSMIADES